MGSFVSANARSLSRPFEATEDLQTRGASRPLGAQDQTKTLVSPR